jgi:hypothetical protein
MLAATPTLQMPSLPMSSNAKDFHPVFVQMLCTSILANKFLSTANPSLGQMATEVKTEGV